MCSGPARRGRRVRRPVRTGPARTGWPPAAGTPAGRSSSTGTRSTSWTGRPDFGADGAGPGGPGDQDPDEGFDAEESRHGVKKGGKGRTFTGAAAAAVTTVLAVVIAGQVAEQRKEGGDPQPRSGNDRTDGVGDEASRSHTRPTQDAKPASYDEKMTQVFPLDAN